MNRQSLFPALFRGWAATLFFLAFLGTASAQTATIFVTNGTFTPPAGATKVVVECWGGGGRGGTRTSNGQGGGGGGGAYARSMVTVTPLTEYTVTVGAGSSSTSPGGDSWFGTAGTVMAKGGNSSADNSATGATGGTAAASIGTFKYDGATGANGGSFIVTWGGGGGSSAGIAAAGAGGSFGTGGTAPSGGGNGGNGASSQGNGTNGSDPGGGGGGAIRSGSGTRTGGTGGGGKVVVTYYTNGTCISGTNNFNSIPDNGCSSSLSMVVPMPFSGLPNTLGTSPGNARLYTVELIVAHTYNSDLRISLTSPGGTTRNLVLNRFGSGDNFGNPATCPSTVFTLRDGGTTLSNSNTNNVSGTYNPEQSLAGFSGDPNGTWLLNICDNAAGDVGNLVYAKLNFCTVPQITAPTSNSPLCAGNALSLGATITGTPTPTLSWAGTGTFTPNNTSANVSVTGPATGNYTLTATSTCGTASATIPVTVNPLPTVTCPGNSSVCISAPTYALTGGSPAGGTYSGAGVSGGNFNPATAGAGAHAITYSYTNGNGCTNSCTFTITVNPLPTVTCPGNSSVCIDAPAYALTGGSPAGGTYSGAGVSGGNFNPATAGAGAHAITYSYTNGNGCTNSCTFTITVNPLPTVTCPGNSSVCISAPTYALTGGSPAGGTYSGAGVSGGNFNPATAGAGAHAITYSYTNGNGCTNSCTFTITVNSLPTVTCPGNSSVCIDAPAYALTGGSPAGGTYSGAGVSGGNFSPATAGAGAHTITYSFTDGNSCSASCTFTITVNPLPVVTCPGNSSVCIDAPAYALTGGSPAGGTYSGAGVSGGNFSPATAGAGAHTITYSYTDGNSCSASCTFTITVNPLPVVTCPGNSSVCIDAPAYALTGGSPAGGTYSGAGVSGGNFSPATAGAGAHTITYSYTDGNSCSASCTFTITVNPLPVVTCPGNSSVCIDAPAYALTGGSPAGGTYSGAGVSGGNFSPATAGAGAHTITYSYTDGNSCSASCTFTITVNPLPAVTCPGNMTGILTTGPSFALAGHGESPAGGSFSGTGVSGGIFIPAAAGAGVHTITYSYTDGNGCGNSCTFSITVTPPCNGNQVVMSITTDNNAAQLGWEFVDGSNNSIASGTLSNAQNNSTVTQTVCLSFNPGPACYGFKLTDSFGDGIANGGWELRTTAGKVILRDSFSSGSVSPANPPATVGYGSAHSFCLPLGPANIETARCGVFNYALGNKIFCNKVTGATQYEFEFTDPDAGFLRRVTKTTNYVQFWDMVVNPLTPGLKYFVRVRSDKDGPLTSAYWGSGCEVGLGVAETVLCSALIPSPLYGHSCNEVRTFNTNNSFIYATPVTGATEYQFRVYNLSEGYDQTFIRSTYILQLKWNNLVAPPLVDGNTYNVQINVQVNGLYSGFCASTCTITINNNPQIGPRIVEQAAGTTTLWPNPASEGQVHLVIDGIQNDGQRIVVDITDIYGKQVFTREFDNSSDRFSTVLQLPDGIASGVYLVGILVDGQRTVHRLSIVK